MARKGEASKKMKAPGEEAVRASSQNSIVGEAHK